MNNPYHQDGICVFFFHPLRPSGRLKNAHAHLDFQFPLFREVVNHTLPLIDCAVLRYRLIDSVCRGIVVLS